MGTVHACNGYELRLQDGAGKLHNIRISGAEDYTATRGE